jgi:N-acetylneuraminic acid mutarotase
MVFKHFSVFRFICLLFLITAILTCSKSSKSTTGPDDEPEPTTGWAEKASMPTARFGMAACTLNGKIIVIGGNDGNSMVNTVEEYNPITDSWTGKNPISTERVLPFANVVGNKIYVIGGAELLFEQTYSLVEEYDPATDSWTIKSNMPTPRGAAVSGVVGGKIYVISGRTGYETDDHQFPKTDAVEMYDPVADSWVKKASIPTARAHACGAVLNGKIYVVGGELYEKGQVVEVYDPATDSWTRKADLPGGGRFAAGAAVVNGKIYVIGGSIIAGGAGTSTVFEYDSVSDAWNELSDLPVQRLEFRVIELNNKLYIIGGTGGPWPYTAHSSVYEYDPSAYE